MTKFSTMFPLYRIGFYNVKIIRYNENKTRHKRQITLGVSISFQ